MAAHSAPRCSVVMKPTAVIEAGRARLRPILMTTGTTVTGLLPLTGWLAAVPLIGALGAGGCGSVSVQASVTPASWGRVKSLFR